MAKNDIECVSVYFKYRMWETSDFDDFEMDNDLERVFGDSVKWFDKDMEPEAFNHAVSRARSATRYAKHPRVLDCSLALGARSIASPSSKCQQHAIRCRPFSRSPPLAAAPRQ